MQRNGKLIIVVQSKGINIAISLNKNILVFGGFEMAKKKYLKVTFLFIIIFYILVNLFWDESYKVENFFRIIAAINLIFILKEEFQ